MKAHRYRLSRHAARRMAQRNLDWGDVALVLHFGRRLHRAGTCFHFFAAKDLPRGSAKALARLVGTTVVTAGERVMTVYRNPFALRRIKRKSKHWPRGGPHAPTSACARARAAWRA